jgi:hypothetical protein
VSGQATLGFPAHSIAPIRRIGCAGEVSGQYTARSTSSGSAAPRPDTSGLTGLCTKLCREFSSS